MQAVYLKQVKASFFSPVTKSLEIDSAGPVQLLDKIVKEPHFLWLPARPSLLCAFCPHSCKTAALFPGIRSIFQAGRKRNKG